jgi:hypothetical protein
MAPIVLSPITKWFIGIGILAVLYFAIVKIYDKGLEWLDEQKQEAVDAAVEAKVATIGEDLANAQLTNIQQQLADQKKSQAAMLQAMSASRRDMQRLEELQKAQNLTHLLQVDPEQGVMLVNANTANAWAEFDAVNKELSHEK